MFVLCDAEGKRMAIQAFYVRWLAKSGNVHVLRSCPNNYITIGTLEFREKYLRVDIGPKLQKTRPITNTATKQCITTCTTDLVEIQFC